MPEIEVHFYREEDGSAPVLLWLEELARRDRRAFNKCCAVIDRLADQGHELRRPTADYLEGGLFELRARVGRVHYRILYFFHGQGVALLIHGLTKEREVPRSEITRAKNRKALFEADPERHTYEEDT